MPPLTNLFNLKNIHQISDPNLTLWPVNLTTVNQLIMATTLMLSLYESIWSNTIMLIGLVLVTLASAWYSSFASHRPSFFYSELTYTRGSPILSCLLAFTLWQNLIITPPTVFNTGLGCASLILLSMQLLLSSRRLLKYSFQHSWLSLTNQVVALCLIFIYSRLAHTFRIDIKSFLTIISTLCIIPELVIAIKTRWMHTRIYHQPNSSSEALPQQAISDDTCIWLYASLWFYIELIILAYMIHKLTMLNTYLQPLITLASPAVNIGLVMSLGFLLGLRGRYKRITIYDRLCGGICALYALKSLNMALLALVFYWQSFTPVPVSWLTYGLSLCLGYLYALTITSLSFSCRQQRLVLDHMISVMPLVSMGVVGLISNVVPSWHVWPWYVAIGVNIMLCAASKRFIASGICLAVSRCLIYEILRCFFTITYTGKQHLKIPEHEPIITTGNHTNLFDVPILGSSYYHKILWPIFPTWMKTWVMRYIGANIGHPFPVSPSNPRNMIKLAKAIKSGRHCVIYPEGSLSVTGNLMKINEGSSFLIDITGAKVQAFVLNGGHQMPLSPPDSRSRTSWFNHLYVGVSPLEKWDTGSLKGKHKRAYLTHLVQCQIQNTHLESYPNLDLFSALKLAKRRYQNSSIIYRPDWSDELSYDHLIKKAVIVGAHIQSNTQNDDRIMLLMDNHCHMAVALFACFYSGRLACIADSTQPASDIIEKAIQANISLIIVDHEHRVEVLNSILTDQTGLKMITIDSLTSRQSRFQTLKYRGLPHTDPRQLPALFWLDDPHKRVYTHHNIAQHAYQLGLSADIRGFDTVFNTEGMLTMHSFMLGFMVPLLHGVKHYIGVLSEKPTVSLLNQFYDSFSTILVTSSNWLKQESPHSNDINTHTMRKIFVRGPLDHDIEQKWSHEARAYLYKSHPPCQYSPIITHQTVTSKPSTLGQLLPCSRVNENASVYSQPDGCVISSITGPHLPIYGLATTQTNRLLKYTYRLPDPLNQDYLGNISLIE
ncbi:MAG: AMP-binding protein [Pseudomonadota bacterium]|nr:AMP-binding protein [Pseudomonadota bacterium]